MIHEIDDNVQKPNNLRIFIREVLKLKPEKFTSLVNNSVPSDVPMRSIRALLREENIKTNYFSAVIASIFDLLIHKYNVDSKFAIVEIQKVFPNIKCEDIEGAYDYFSSEYKNRIDSILEKGEDLRLTLKNYEISMLKKVVGDSSLSELKELVTSLSDKNKDIKEMLNLFPPEPLDIYVEKGKATNEEVSEYLLELSILYEVIGGSGLRFDVQWIEEFETEEEPV